MRYRLGLGNSWDDAALLADRLALLKEGQEMPLSVKVGKAQALIQEALADHGADHIYVAFSGGQDSAVVAHLVRQIAPEVRLVFSNTSLEMPETLEYIRWWEDTNHCRILETRPFKKPLQVIREHGYPMFSKRIAYMLRSNARSPSVIRYLHDRGLAHILTTGVSISDECCYYLKHGPGETLAKKLGATACFLGMKAEDSRDRRRNWLSKGCYYPVKKGQDRVWPLAFWTDHDVREYHRLIGLPHAALYDKGFTRNGCYLCGFGCHIASPNKFELLAEHHPNIWARAMERFGYFEACEKLRVRDGRGWLFR